jgi:DNA-binding cell septation regulator SpoVG
MSLEYRRIQIIDEKKHAKAHKQGVRAFLDITINGWQFNGYRIMDHGNGLWVSAPTVRSAFTGRDGKERNYYHPIVQHEKDSVNSVLHDDLIAHFSKVKAGEAAVTEEKETEKVY